MSVTLGALVIAISTEFSVLLSERYREERRRGHEPREALARTYRSTGAAVLASGATAIAGFAVLVASDIRMLRDFGFVTVVDLTVSLLGVLVVLPAVLLLAERRGGRRASPESLLRRGAPPSASDHRRQRAALAIGHRADGLGLGHADRPRGTCCSASSPQRRWLSSSSAIVMLAASHGQARMTAPTVVLPSATLRLSSARASRTSLAR